MSTICFTGPRPNQLHGYSESARRDLYNRLVAVTAGVVDQFAAQGCTRFISGGAQGFDQLAFWAVHRVRRQRPELENLVYRPFEGQDSVWSPAGLFSQSEYQSMLGAATGVVTCGNRPLGKSDAVAALHGRNHRMVADSDIVFALLAGRSLDYQNSAGGTAECVRYALSQGKTVFALSYRPELAEPFSSGYLN